MGGYAVLEPFDPAFVYNGPHTLRNPYTNVVGILPGRLGAAAPGFFMMGAHFDATSMRDASVDTLWDPFIADAPGADDNASGVSTILEALRVAAARGIRPEADVHIAFFDGEELQMIQTGRFLLGSNELADTTRAIEDAGGERLYALLNADMVAYNPRQDSLVVLTNIPSRWLGAQILAVHETGGYAAGMQVERVVRGLSNSDHGPFWEKGFDAVMLIETTDVEQHAPHYHRSFDTVDNTYSRGGSQAALTADLFVGMLGEWSRTGPDSLVVADEDILVQFGNAVDLASVDVDDEVTVVVGVTNRGGTRTEPLSVTLDIETLDREFVRSLGTQVIDEVIPAGAHVKARFPWSPAARRGGRGALGGDPFPFGQSHRVAPGSGARWRARGAGGVRLSQPDPGPGVGDAGLRDEPGRLHPDHRARDRCGAAGRARHSLRQGGAGTGQHCRARASAAPGRSGGDEAGSRALSPAGGSVQPGGGKRRRERRQVRGLAMIGGGRTVPAGPRFFRGLNAVLGLLYLIIAGLIVYFRLGPVQRVMDRLVRDGVEPPAWFPVVFTVGPILIGAFLIFQGWRYLRRSLVLPSPRSRGD